MTELISFIVFICSLLVMGVIILRKLPILIQLPENTRTQNQLKEVFNLKRMGELTPSRYLSLNMLLQKIVSKIRILILKIDTKTFNLLQKLREKSQKNKFNENENYWQEIRKSTRKK